MNNPSNNEKIKFTDRAFLDLRQIWMYHAEYNKAAANIVEEVIYKAVYKIAENPQAYPVRKDLTLKPYRFCLLVKYSYYIIYNPISKPLEIMRIISSRRDVSSTL